MTFDARFRQQTTDCAALLVQQRDQNVGRLDELVILAYGQRLRIGKRHLEFTGQFVHSHCKNLAKMSHTKI